MPQKTVVPFFFIFSCIFPCLRSGRLDEGSDDNLEDKIVGGQFCPVAQYPFMISILQFKSGTQGARCGGTLLNARWVLTAAHCIKPMAVKNRLVVLGGGCDFMSEQVIKDHQSHLQKRIVDAYLRHPKYQQVLSMSPYDVALVRASAPFDIDNGIVRPVALADSSIHFDSCKIGIVAGWGTTNVINPAGEIIKNPVNQSNSVQPANVEIIKLRCVEMPIIPIALCHRMYPSAVLSNSTDSFCGHQPGGGKDACQGDSGGPFLCNGTQVGIVKGGAGCGDPIYGGLFERIDFHLDFIMTYKSFHDGEDLEDIYADSAKRKNEYFYADSLFNKEDEYKSDKKHTNTSTSTEQAINNSHRKNSQISPLGLCVIFLGVSLYNATCR